ncbi:MAG: ABC transporter permease, partial [Pseudomonadota bacterium]
MLRYALKRLVSMVLSLAVASIVIFSVIEIAPGDPASFMLGVNAQADTLAALRAELGLDVPKLQRYLSWVGGMLTGDFGTSYTYRTPVSEMIADRLWVSLPLTVYAMVLSMAIAFPAGIYAAARRGKPGDITVMGATQLGVAVPNFWFAMMLVLVFAINLRWFGAGGFAGWDKGIWPAIHSLTLPAIAMALPQAAILTRVMRSSLLDVLGEDFMRTARAKGLS